MTEKTGICWWGPLGHSPQTSDESRLGIGREGKEWIQVVPLGFKEPNISPSKTDFQLNTSVLIFSPYLLIDYSTNSVIDYY